jgi:hypothetical protein
MEEDEDGRNNAKIENNIGGESKDFRSNIAQPIIKSSALNEMRYRIK